MTAGRERLAVLALAVVGAALALLTAARPWLDVTVKDPLVGSGRLYPDGRDVAALVPAAALVALAASVSAVTMRRIGRQVAALLLVAAGGAIASAAVSVIAGPSGSAEEAVRQATGRTGGLGAVTATATSWPWLAVLAAGPVVLAGAMTVVRGRTWSGLSARYEAPGEASEPSDRSNGAVATEPDVAWDALSRGEDPTA
jgi:uncharacterized membrane protein (TIGR02234 family)